MIDFKKLYQIAFSVVSLSEEEEKVLQSLVRCHKFSEQLKQNSRFTMIEQQTEQYLVENSDKLRESIILLIEGDIIQFPPFLKD